MPPYSTRKPTRSATMPPPSPTLDLLPQGDENHYRYGGGNNNNKYHLRVSSSLQDFSTYDLESDERYGASPPKPTGAGKESFCYVRRRWSPTAVWVFLFLSLVVAACFLFFGKFWSSPGLLPEYYVVFDCGSTGTRVFVYEATLGFAKGGDNGGGFPIELRLLPEGMKARSGRAYKRMETEPGFANLVRNELGLRSAMMPLIEFAEKQIPRSAHKRTSVFLCATAGVRKLPKVDSEWVLEKVWEILKESRFVSRREWVRIISGMEEGYYGWIALNYRMGNLGSVEGGRETVGALGLGGSSLQVTFETDKAMQDENSLNLSIGVVKHRLSAYSLLGYGLNDAFDKSVVHLLKKLTDYTIKNLSSGELVVKHPCLQTGYKEKYVCSQCAPISQDAGPVTGEGTAVKGRAGVPVELLGAPHWGECNALAKATVNLSEWSGSSSVIDCDIRPCALGDGLPSPRGHFYAMSGFFVVYRFFNLSSEATLDELLLKGQDFCEETWESAKNSVVPQPFIEQYCFRAPYVASLLRHGLHITNDEVVIGSGSITWTLGVALLEAGQALSSRMHVPLYGMLPWKASSFSLLILILVSIVVLICAISMVSKWFQKFSQRAYLPLKHDDATSGHIYSIPFPFNFQHCKRASSGDGKMKMPLSPVAGAERHSGGSGYGLGGGSIQSMGSSSHNTALGLSHSRSSGSLFLENGTRLYLAQRGSTQLLSRKSLSREDLSSMLTLHTMKK